MSVPDTAKSLKLINRLSALLMVVMLILQFTPFWHFGEGGAQTVSISSYVWFPDNHTDLNAYLKTVEEGHWVNSIVVVAVPMLLLCAIGAVLCLRASDSRLTLLFPVAAGLVGLIGYLGTASLRAGAWGLPVVVCAAMLLLGLCGLVGCRKKKAAE